MATKKARYFIAVDEVKPADVAAEEGFRGVDSRLVISDRTVGSDSGCMFRVIFPKGAYHGPHWHAKSDELLYTLRGKAIQWVDGKKYIMRPGTAMCIPKNVVHWMRNDWDEEVEVIGVYPSVPNFYDTDQRVSDDWEKHGFEKPNKSR